MFYSATARIGMEKMKFMWETSLHFVLTLEGLSGSTAYVIRQCLLTQTRAFLEHLHSAVKVYVCVCMNMYL
jgi:hypothetical protein